MSELILSPVDLVFSDGESVQTDSLKVARAFGKSHKHVIRAIENLECSMTFAKRNFGLCYENNGLQNGKPRKFYQLTRDGAMLLIMGFTGKRAMAAKEAFISAFTAMENQLRIMMDYANVCRIESAEKATASDCGRGLNAWKQIKHSLADTKKALEDAMQPDLFVAISE